MQCGEVFCDRCGDCIRCYGDDPCYDEGDHSYDYPEEIEEEEVKINDGEIQ
jgi:hypothetical protein